MKNVYIYGQSDDCHEVESDFGLGDEFYSDAMLNTLKIHWEYDGDWKITTTGKIPDGWVLHKIDGTSQVVHVQIPNGDKVTLREYHDPDEIDEDDRPGYLIDYVASWTEQHGITDINRFHEKFQIDSFQQKVESFAEEVIKIANKFAKDKDND